MSFSDATIFDEESSHYLFDYPYPFQFQTMGADQSTLMPIQCNSQRHFAIFPTENEFNKRCGNSIARSILSVAAP